MKKYIVINKYGIAGGSEHRSIKAALKARDKREGGGWYVCDDDGCVYDGSRVDGYEVINNVLREFFNFGR
jgi:hypothetical protein